MRRVARLALVVSALGVAASATGCTSRPTQRIAAAPATPRDGWVTFGPRVRLRDDTPPLASVLPAPEASPTWDPSASQGYVGAQGYVGPEGQFGPEGAAGPRSAPGFAGYEGGYGYGYTPFFAPGGAVPPGLRMPSDERATSPFAAPFRTAFPGADVTAHRPGLSTGSGVFGRKDDGPTPDPAPRR